MKLPAISIFIISSLLLFGTNLFGQTQLKKSVISGKQIVCYGNQEVHRVYIPPPKGFDPANKGQGDANFEVEYIDFSDTAKQAFQYAVDIWSALVNSPVPIRIEANWKSLGSNVLGNCAPSVFYLGGYLWAPVSDEYYSVALAEKIYGHEINDTLEPDLVANFSSGADWYYGTDGNCPGDRYDLVSTVLHEIAHGLGFIGTMGMDEDSLGFWGFANGKTITFDHWIENGSGERMMNTSIFENPSAELLDEFTSDNLYYNSLIAVLNNAGQRPKLYAPSEFNDGSSIYHLNDATYLPASGNSLMTHSASLGEAVHHPGPIVMGMFADWGWIHTKFDHEPIIDAEDLSQPFTVITKILSDTTFNEDTTFVYYSLDGFTSYDSVKLMPTANPDEFSADIPVPGIDTTIHYYLSTYDYFDRHYTSPPYVPDQYYSFYVGPDTVNPFITHVPVEFTLVSTDSLQFQATVTDNIGIDSVYIEYYLNETGQDPVTMQYDTLNKYSGFMIFSEGTLQMGDSILYRIAAVDSSQNANLTYSPAGGYYYKIIVDEIRDVQDAYQNDFDTESDDFLFTGFSIISPQGFSDTALHTTHPYESPDAENETIEYTAQLKIPIHLKDTGAYMSFDEIVLVEPGESGTNYGDEEFWDYVVVEGSKDNGNNWIAIEPGYDCKRESFWLTKYNSSTQDNNSMAIGTPDLYQYHQIDLLQDDNFTGGDTILIRFRLFSDPYAHGWGWVIDNLKIQGDVAIGEKKIIAPNDFHIYPNPSSGSFTISGTFNQPVKQLSFMITDLVGRQIFSREILNTGNSFNEQFNITNQPAGLYLVVIRADNQKIVRKLLKSR